ncbi:MAG: hypothetical protein U1E74_03295 [Paenacidovorax caeni]
MNASGCGSSSSAYSDAAPLWAADAVRNKIVVISDIHLGIEDRYTETLKNRPLLIKFLQCLQNTKDVRELVIAGDFLDEWFFAGLLLSAVYRPGPVLQERHREQLVSLMS